MSLGDECNESPLCAHGIRVEQRQELSVRENIMMGAYGAGFSGVFASALRLPHHRQLERTAQERADQWIGRLGLCGRGQTHHRGHGENCRCGAAADHAPSARAITIS